MTPERYPSPRFWATSSLPTPSLPGMSLSRVSIPKAHLLSTLNLEKASWISSVHQNICFSGITNIYKRENVNLEIYIFVCLPLLTCPFRATSLTLPCHISNVLTWLVTSALSLETSFASFLPSIYTKQTDKQTKHENLFSFLTVILNLILCFYVPLFLHASYTYVSTSGHSMLF